MSLESRNGRGTYYTRSRRVDGQVIRTYVGSGPDALQAAEIDKAMRMASAQERTRQVESDRAMRAFDLTLARYCQAVDREIERELAEMKILRRRSEWRVVR